MTITEKDLASVNKAYRNLLNKTKEVLNMEEKVVDILIKEEEPEDKERATIASALTCCHTAANQIEELTSTIYNLLASEVLPINPATETPVGVFYSCLSLADKLISIKEKLSTLKDIVQ